MSIDQVIENGTITLWESFQYTIEYDMFYPLLFLFLASSCSVLNVLNDLNAGERNIVLLLLNLTFFPIVIFAGSFFLCIFFRNDMVEIWKETEVTPFIQSLENQKVVVQDVQIDVWESPDYDDENYSLPKKYYTNKPIDALRKVVVLYKGQDNKPAVYQGEAVILFDLEQGETIYMTYKYVPKDLMKKKEFLLVEVDGIEKGVYNPVIHLRKE